MSLSALPIENSWQGVSETAAPSMMIPSAARSANLESIRRSVPGGIFSFPGRLEIPGAIRIPEQEFSVSFKGMAVVIENHPTGSWPKLIIEGETDASFQELRVKEIALRLSEDTVDGWLWHTRILLLLSKAQTFSIQAAPWGQVLEVEFVMLSEAQEKELLQLARLIRKLKFIQTVFRRTKFLLPGKFTKDDLRGTEILFRGITEGEFTIRDPRVTIKGIPLSEIDLTKPPFDGAGSFSHKIGNKQSLLGKEFIVGPITVYLDKAELASPKVIEHIRKGFTQPVDVRFEVLDNQITYHFEAYAQLSHKQRLHKLNQFKQELGREEPKELVNLVDESLQGDVSSDEAAQIAVGWTQYNCLPDRYCPQEPILDEANSSWRVPIYLVYTSGEGGPVGELQIDLKTGKIIEHTPIEELRSRGLALAEKILHA